MFDVVPDEIALLNDTDLRELVGRLCEAELTSLALSPVAVTWGGSQTAADGGLDVRVTLPIGTVIDGFVPRASTGFQVKKSDMTPTEILAEMRKAGAIRPRIQELADKSGAYIIVSSSGSTADTALRKRRNAMREALIGIPNAELLTTDFYDRTRLATWVRRHPGLIVWVKEKVGRVHAGWRTYGSWSGAAEGVDAEYLLDTKLRIHVGRQRNASAQPIAEVIDALRDELALPRRVLRLVGLSGVGKTRLVQALFDARIGSRALLPSLAVYTNMSDNPDPQPLGLASDLIANRTRAILIVDNCLPTLHRALANLCNSPESMVSVITVEYDVRDDQPEGTQVVTLDTSSPDLIERLVLRRYPQLSSIDARTIASVSGGNARIAIAIAGTVENFETIAGLSDDELFQRLFRQRHDTDRALLVSAQACSLVYSFQGEALFGGEAEIPRLAAIADQTPRELYRNVSELLRRDLAQQRGVWRAILPQALANHLAARALDETPPELIVQQLVTGGSDRLARSFSRRLAFLHDHPHAVTIVEQWLAPGSLLGDVTTHADLEAAMFENVAPVSPSATLAALERVGTRDRIIAVTVWHRHRLLLRSLAYDPSLFERSALLLAQAAAQSPEEARAKECTDVFISLFTLYLSGTHASVEKRLNVIEHLLRSKDDNARSVGLSALDRLLMSSNFSSTYSFDFGGRSRDYGYKPSSDADVKRWFGAALELIRKLALAEGLLKIELRDLLARRFRGLWVSSGTIDELERLFRGLAKDGFWLEGWVACNQSLRFDKDQFNPDSKLRLSALEAELRPSRLADRVLAIALSEFSASDDLDEEDEDFGVQHEKRETAARELGAAVAADDRALAEILPYLLRVGSRAFSFGRGLAGASSDRSEIWRQLVQGLNDVPFQQRNIQVLKGFLAEIWDTDRDLAQSYLDAAEEQPALQGFLPVLHAAVELDRNGVERLRRALKSNRTPVHMFRYLDLRGPYDSILRDDLADLLRLIADHPGGFDVSRQLLSERYYWDWSVHESHEQEFIAAGRDLLRRLEFKRNNPRSDFDLARIVEVCLDGPEFGPIAMEVVTRLASAVAAYETHSFDNDQLLAALLKVQPVAVLDALLEIDSTARERSVHLFSYLANDRSNPANQIPCDRLIAWCDQDPHRRYLFAASIVSVACRVNGSGPQTWLEHAKALLVRAPHAKDVLSVFVGRFRPMTWSGSLATEIEGNARLLDDLNQSICSPDIVSFVAQAKERLSREVAEELERESARARDRYERFEFPL